MILEPEEDHVGQLRIGLLADAGRGLQTQHQSQSYDQPTDHDVLHEKSPFPGIESDQNVIIVG